MADDPKATAFGPNAWLVDEMYEQYQADPSSVSESWRDFFADYGRNGGGATPTTATPSTATPDDAPAAPATAPADAAPDGQRTEPTRESTPGQPIRGPAARIVANMEASLAVPTATSARSVPPRLLEVNRKVINGYLGRTSGGKVSFTHLIGYAVVKAVRDVPVMNSTFVPGDDGARVVRNEHVGLGLAVDVEKSDGSHTLLVPCIKDADTLDFRGFWSAYEELIRKVRNNKIGPDDFAGVTMTLTNPGTIGTVHSGPRPMPGQGAIIGVGTIDYPAEYQGADPRTIARLGVAKVVTLTSTYDHRIIQGAEPGEALRHVHQLPLGDDGFYDEIFTT